MNSNIIDFNESKTKLINKRYPNITNAVDNIKKGDFLASNKALDDFQIIYFKYKNYLSGKKGATEVKLDEVLHYFGIYFDEIYKLFIKFDDDRVTEFKEMLDYAMLSQGKRLRPFLIFVSYCFSYGDDFMILAPLMVAMEMIHTFSLIHDDLPCMDNDTLRRGKETVWKKYGEDMGVLVGDALMMQAASILMEMVLEFAYTPIGTSVITSSLVLLKLAGLDGMITGQVFDVMNTTNKNLSIDDICFMYDKKTTALLQASLLIGALMSGGLGEQIELMELLGSNIGEAYQIKDDLLEIESTKEKIGKSTNSDKDKGKITYVEKVGVAASKKRLLELESSCIFIIDELTTSKNQKEANVFKDIIKFLFSRDK